MRLIPRIEDIFLTSVLWKVKYELQAAAILGPEGRSSGRWVGLTSGVDRGAYRNVCQGSYLVRPHIRSHILASAESGVILEFV